MDEKQQELAQKFAVFEQQIQLFQQQLQAVENAIVEISSLNLGLDEMAGKKDREILANIGRGIYAKAKLISDELIVDVGGKNFVKKSIPETKKIIEEQIKKLKNIREELNSELEKINEELTRVFVEGQKGRD